MVLLTKVLSLILLTTELEAAFLRLRSRGTYGDYDIGETAFNTLFSNNPSFLGSSGTIIRRECSSCLASHQDIYYVRLTPVSGLFNPYQDFSTDWFDDDNERNVDFNLYSSLTDALSNVSAWTYCNFDDATVGFPRDCGPSGKIDGQWSSFTNPPTGQADVRFSIYAPNDFINVLSKGSYGNYDIGATAFNQIFQDSSAHIIRRECQDCLATHENIYYRRLTQTTTFTPYSYMANDWLNTNNVIDIDFNLFNTLDGARNNDAVSKWLACNHVAGIGFPRDCRPAEAQSILDLNQWNDFTGSPPGGQQNVRFSIYLGN